MTTSLTDAIAITGAASGAVIAAQSTTIGPLTAPQKAALITFINALGAPFTSANITQVAVYRQAGLPGNIMVGLTGLVLPASAATAITNRTQYDDIIGIVP